MKLFVVILLPLKLEQLKQVERLLTARLKHRPDSQRYHEIKSEIMGRKMLRPKTNKYKLDTKTEKKEKETKK
jgi:hypothetical protein